MWETDPHLDISVIASFQSYYQRLFTAEIKQRQVKRFTFNAYPFCKELARLLPDLKEHVSPWHLIIGDVYIIPCNCTNYSEIESLFRNYLGTKLKGAIIFKNTAFLVVYDK